jgi:hypothetical protein
MSQLHLALLARIDAPSVIPYTQIAGVSDYRAAVRLCWMHRRSTGMTRSTLAELTGMRACLIVDYLDPATVSRAGVERRDMPAKYITAMEAVCGNTFISQYIAAQSKLTVLESLSVRAA